MTSFMMPHVYARLMPEHLTIAKSSKAVINETLAHYLTIAHKAIEQYVEIWENMSKITNLYENLGEHPRSYYEMLEILNVYKLDESVTACYLSAAATAIISIICNMKKGEHCVIKAGDMFSQESVDRMYILSLCFNEVYLYKPASTPAITSDKYIICKDFKMINAQHLNHLTDCFSYSRRINCTYINALAEANSVFGQQQLEAINNTITLIEQGKKKEKIEALKRQQAAKCAEWNKRFGVTFKGRQCDVGGI